MDTFLRWAQFGVVTSLALVAAEIHRRHTKSELYTLEAEASVLDAFDNNPEFGNFRRLLLLAGVDVSFLCAGILGAGIASGCNIGFQVQFGNIIKVIITDPDSLDAEITVQLLYALGMFLGNLMQMGFIEMAGTRLVTRIQRLTF